MTKFEPRSSGVGSDHSATTAAISSILPVLFSSQTSNDYKLEKFAIFVCDGDDNKREFWTEWRKLELSISVQNIFSDITFCVSEFRFRLKKSWNKQIIITIKIPWNSRGQNRRIGKKHKSSLLQIRGINSFQINFKAKIEKQTRPSKSTPTRTTTTTTGARSWSTLERASAQTSRRRSSNSSSRSWAWQSDGSTSSSGDQYCKTLLSRR